MQPTKRPLPNANSDRQSVISPAVALRGQFRMRTLGGEEIAVTCQTEKVVGKRLIAKLTSSIPAGTGVRIDCDDAFIVGEVLGCWREGQTTFTAIELQHQLAGLAQFAALNEELFGSNARVVEYAGRKNC